jgi:twitching motility two-component system response regulator PilG
VEFLGFYFWAFICGQGDMQGELSEIDVRSILQLVELGQRTGQLLVETYASLNDRTADRAWYVFFSNGQVVYAGNPAAGLSRLKGFLASYGLESHFQSLTTSVSELANAPEYGALWKLLETRVLSTAQAKEVLQGMVQETLFDLLSLHQGYFMFEKGPPLMPQLSALEVMPIVTSTLQQVQEWKQWYPQVQSPEQIPMIVDAAALQEALPTETVKTLISFVDGQTSLRQIARALSRDVLAVTRALHPCLQRGWIQFVEDDRARSSRWDRETVKSRPKPCVACLDDAATVRYSVENILDRHGYRSVLLDDPIAALSQFFSVKPDLILCDITMPDLDGYEVCAMLRQSSYFRQTPIVMLTGRDGFIDRVRAQMVGATDYLAKPFGEEELVTIVEKYVGRGSLPDPEPPQAHLAGEPELEEPWPEV